jgi:hypothetical protein
VADYRLFEPPDKLVERGVRNWTPHEADEFFAWLMEVAPNRVRQLRRLLKISPSADPVEELRAVGERLVPMLGDDEFSELGRPEIATLRGNEVIVPAGRQVTTLGYAVLADVGLLLATRLIEKLPVEWSVLRKPKSAVFINRPVLTGFDRGLHIDPIQMSVNLGHRVLRGEEDAGAWARAYEWWASQVAGPIAEAEHSPRSPLGT